MFFFLAAPLAMDVPVVASSVAAAALPQELSSLLAAEARPEQMAARVAGYVLDPPPRTGVRHTSVKNYVDALDLAAQLEHLVRGATGQSIGEHESQQKALARQPGFLCSKSDQFACHTAAFSDGETGSF